MVKIYAKIKVIYLLNPKILKCTEISRILVSGRKKFMSITQSTYSSGKAERLEARLSSAQKELIQKAADLQGRSLTDFVISSSQEKAQQVIREHEIISLSSDESKLFVDALFSEREPNTALRQAAKTYQTIMNGRAADQSET